MAAVRPTGDVLAAFGVRGDPVPLPGGQGRSWLIDAVVLKPADTDGVAVAWQADVLTSVDGDTRFRVSPPVPALDGRWIVEGWTAWRWQPGVHLPHHWSAIAEVGDAFHAALAEVPAPAWLSQRDDPWAAADRIAWDAPFAAVTTPPQLIYGDRALLLLRARVFRSMTDRLLSSPVRQDAYGPAFALARRRLAH